MVAGPKVTSSSGVAPSARPGTERRGLGAGAPGSSSARAEAARRSRRAASSERILLPPEASDIAIMHSRRRGSILRYCAPQDDTGGRHRGVHGPSPQPSPLTGRGGRTSGHDDVVAELVAVVARVLRQDTDGGR